jgi:hypothetical protein
MSLPRPPAFVFEDNASLKLPDFSEYDMPHCLEMRTHLERVKEESEAWAALEALEAMIREL